ncbi:FkbM family methyltransferase [Oscillatoria sp. FACHB-1406]|uniref:FkbM family methyltransferase n=1 Tax=Oscillatoria sp. FACHB-1406 TaxID=2692846 RepID=UPI001682DBCD|nr:FkbM family methyltransferase [Oscillatoria sp. FACHB-1406]MBD2579878.1 FkbM family methyltransferase [Oscillatoria sp. FACHB-1406]
MSKLKSFLKKVIKTISGYDINGCGRGSYGLARKNVEMESLYPGSIILREKTEDEVQGTRGIYDYLRRLRLKTILEKYQIDVVLDVGANIGQFGRELRAMGYEGKIISFEPISSAFEVLKQVSGSDPNWEIHKLALGRQNGEQKIHVASDSAFTSFLKSNAWCEKQFGESAVGSREETVTVRRLDEVLNEMVEKREQARMYLKMDTQGYDLEAIAGLEGQYDGIFGLQSEISVIPIYQGMPHLTESISFFEKAGFEIAGLYPVSQQSSTVQVIEFDCLMVKSSRKKELELSNALSTAVS